MESDVPVNIKFQANGIDAYITYMESLHKRSEGLIKRAVYDGASVYGEAMMSAINAIPVTSHKFYYGDFPITGMSPQQKAGLVEGFGFAKMENKSGFINTKAGFDGYNSVKSKRFPNGQPNALIANALNSGTSRRPKYSFVDKATRASRDGIISAMSKRFDADMEEIKQE